MNVQVVQQGRAGFLMVCLPRGEGFARRVLFSVAYIPWFSLLVALLSLSGSHCRYERSGRA